MIQTVKVSQNSPFFLQGLLYARTFLKTLKEKKEQEQLDMSPIPKKSIKLSTDFAIQQQPHERKSLERGHPQDGFEIEEPQATGKADTKIQIKHFEKKINQLGTKLEKVYQDIASCEVVFHNLCEFYASNQNIIMKYTHMKKQNLRIREEKTKYIEETKNIQNQIQQMKRYEKKLQEQMKKGVENYVRDVFQYNQDYLDPLIREPYNLSMEQVHSSSDQSYDKNLNFKYKKLWKQKCDAAKKKTLAEPKKIHKVISFEEQIDSVTKYYESEFTDL